MIQKTIGAAQPLGESRSITSRGEPASIVPQNRGRVRAKLALEKIEIAIGDLAFRFGFWRGLGASGFMDHGDSVFSRRNPAAFGPGHFVNSVAGLCSGVWLVCRSHLPGLIFGLEGIERDLKAVSLRHYVMPAVAEDFASHENVVRRSATAQTEGECGQDGDKGRRSHGNGPEEVRKGGWRSESAACRAPGDQCYCNLVPFDHGCDQYWSPLITDPSILTRRSYQIVLLTEFLMNRTLPSPRPMFTPPGCMLRAWPPTLFWPPLPTVVP